MFEQIVDIAESTHLKYENEEMMIVLKSDNFQFFNKTLLRDHNCYKMGGIGRNWQEFNFKKTDHNHWSN